MWTGQNSWLFTKWVPGLTMHILFVTKSLEPSNHFSTIISQTSQCKALPCLVKWFRFIMLQFPAWEITVLINHSFVSTNYVSQALYQMLQTTRMKYGRLLSLPRLTIGIPSQSSALDSLSTVKHSNFQIILAHHEVFVSHSAPLCQKRVALRGKRSITEGRWVAKYT